jgi:glycosyltransferase involved in cell wall biosynthesis
MLKVVCVVDKTGTALDRLAKGVAKYHDNIDYEVVDVHPKRPDQAQLQAFQAAAMNADIIDWQYFRTAETLRGLFPWLKDKKQILTHNNPYSIEEQDWAGYDMLVGNNDYIYKRLGEISTVPIEKIPLSVDTDFWQFNPDPLETDKKTVIMVANRIEGKKGILPVAIACGDLGIKFILVGAISDQEYFHSIMQTGNVEFHEQITDEELRQLYYRSTVHVCNSVDNFESGTLPVLEAMLCGVPVLSREVGHVPDLNNGENMVIHKGDSEAVEVITELLRDMIYDKKRLEDIRQAGWNSAKVRSFERRAYSYQKLYRQVLHEFEAPVSIIVPIFDKPEIIRKNLGALADQTYKNIEAVVVDDGAFDFDAVGLVADFAQYVSFPVRYIRTDEPNKYGLARARNEGIIEATGDILIFADQRMILDPDAVAQFVSKLKPKYWLYGNKGAKKEFVENFSCVYRQEVINAGMFNERINRYGGQSQEIRSRIRRQGFQTEYVESAKATPAGKSSNKNRKKADIIAMKNRLWKMGLE